MAKTNLTKELEKAIQLETNQWFGCLEVTIGWYGKQRVDFMTMDTKEIFRCFEIKVSKSDFHSKHGHNFVGHYNYYVMPYKLYEEVKEEIPKYIGVYTFKNNQRLCCIKHPKKQEVQNIDVLKNSMIRSLYREVCKIKDSKNIDLLRKLKNNIAKLEKEKIEIKKEYMRDFSIMCDKLGKDKFYELMDDCSL